MYYITTYKIMMFARATETVQVFVPHLSLEKAAGICAIFDYKYCDENGSVWLLQIEEE